MIVVNNPGRQVTTGNIADNPVDESEAVQLQRPGGHDYTVTDPEQEFGTMSPDGRLRSARTVTRLGATTCGIYRGGPVGRRLQGGFGRDGGTPPRLELLFG